MQALETALYNRLSTDATLNGIVAGVHVGAAPNGPYPMLLIEKVSGDPTYTLAAMLRETYLYQIRVVHNTRSVSAGLSALARVRALLQNHALSVAGYTTMLCRWDSDIPHASEMRDGIIYTHVGAVYRIEVR